MSDKPQLLERVPPVGEDSPVIECENCESQVVEGLVVGVPLCFPCLVRLGQSIRSLVSNAVSRSQSLHDRRAA